MRIVAIIQARMGSSRLPGKVLKLLADKPVLQHVIERVRLARVFDEVAVATTIKSIDDDIEILVNRCDAVIVRGDEDDVLGRYRMAANQTDADAIMRITADCPLIDPDVLCSMVENFKTLAPDLITNARKRTFPRGLDAELFTREALESMSAEAEKPAEREHVTPFLYSNPERFSIVDHVSDNDHSDIRLTLDTMKDLELLKKIFSAFPEIENVRIGQVLELLHSRPELQDINAHIEQKEIW